MRMRRRENNKIVEERIKTLRRENNKIVEEGIKHRGGNKKWRRETRGKKNSLLSLTILIDSF